MWLGQNLEGAQTRQHFLEHQAHDQKYKPTLTNHVRKHPTQPTGRLLINASTKLPKEIMDHSAKIKC